MSGLPNGSAMPVLLLLLILVAGVVAGLLLDPRAALLATVIVWAVVVALALPLLDLGFWLSWLAFLTLSLAPTRLGARRRRRRASG
jgi:hypothetical protein